jgi:tetratricopeptide (TPR) repeat protein
VGRYSEAVADLEEVQKLEPQNRDIERELGLAYPENQQYATATKDLGPTMNAGLNDAEMLAAPGQADARLGNSPQARARLERVLKAHPSDHFNAYQLATVLLAMKDARGAAHIFSELKREVGDLVQFHLLVGRANESAGYHAQSDAELRRALALDPKVHWAHYLVGMSALERGDGSHLDEAQREFEAEVRYHPDEFPPLFMLGVLMEMKRQWAPALAYLHRAPLRTLWGSVAVSTVSELVK